MSKGKIRKGPQIKPHKNCSNNNKALRKARVSLGLTQIQLASLIGISKSNYAPYESQGILPKRERAEEIVYILETSLEEIFPAYSSDAFSLPNKKRRSLLHEKETRSPLEILQEREFYEQIFQLVLNLPERERQVLDKRYGFSGEIQTFESIGVSLGCSKERAKQIEAQALRKLYLKLYKLCESYDFQIKSTKLSPLTYNRHPFHTRSKML